MAAKTPAQKTAAQKTATRKTATPKTAAKKAAGKRAAVGKAATAKVAAPKAAARKVTARKAPAQKAGRKPRAKTFRVTLGNNGKVIECARHETVLHAALRVGIDYPYACATGNCGMCISKLDDGKVSMLPRNDTSLTPEQEEAGQTLACRARPRSDLAVTWLGRGRK